MKKTLAIFILLSSTWQPSSLPSSLAWSFEISKWCSLTKIHSSLMVCVVEQINLDSLGRNRAKTDCDHWCWWGWKWWWEKKKWKKSKTRYLPNHTLQDFSIQKKDVHLSLVSHATVKIVQYKLMMDENVSIFAFLSHYCHHNIFISKHHL